MNKASENLFFAKQFRIDYKYRYDIDIYNVECVAYTFNNVVENVLYWLLSTKRDDQKISNYINR